MSKLIDSLTIKANTTKEVSRLKKEIESAEREINTQKFILGSKVFDAWSAGGFAAQNEEIEAACAAIKAKLESVEATHRQISEVESDMELRLGALQAQEGFSQAGGAAVCPSCGSVNVAAAKFCRGCGTKL